MSDLLLTYLIENCFNTSYKDKQNDAKTTMIVVIKHFEAYYNI